MMPSTGDRSDCRALLAVTSLPAIRQFLQHRHDLGPAALVETKKETQVLRAVLAGQCQGLTTASTASVAATADAYPVDTPMHVAIGRSVGCIC